MQGGITVTSGLRHQIGLINQPPVLGTRPVASGLRLEPARSMITIRRFIVPIQVRNSFSRQFR